MGAHFCLTWPNSSFFDLFNHKPNTDVLTGYNARRGTFEVIVNSPVKSGEQVFIEYGFEKVCSHYWHFGLG